MPREHNQNTYCVIFLARRHSRTFLLCRRDRETTGKSPAYRTRVIVLICPPLKNKRIAARGVRYYNVAATHDGSR